MGILYRAVDRQSAIPVAVKVVTGAGSSDRERFAREARALCTLEHPAIVRYVASGTTGRGPLWPLGPLAGRFLALVRAAQQVSASLLDGQWAPHMPHSRVRAALSIPAEERGAGLEHLMHWGNA